MICTYMSPEQICACFHVAELWNPGPEESQMSFESPRVHYVTRFSSGLRQSSNVELDLRILGVRCGAEDARR